MSAIRDALDCFAEDSGSELDDTDIDESYSPAENESDSDSGKYNHVIFFTNIF